jgi:hypothetical protein
MLILLCIAFVLLMIPALLFVYFLVGIAMSILLNRDLFNWSKIKSFLDKPLFAREKKKEIKTIGVVLDKNSE